MDSTINNHQHGLYHTVENQPLLWFFQWFMLTTTSGGCYGFFTQMVGGYRSVHSCPQLPAPDILVVPNLNGLRNCALYHQLRELSPDFLIISGKNGTGAVSTTRICSILARDLPQQVDHIHFRLMNCAARSPCHEHGWTYPP